MMIELEVALRQVLKSVVREVADEVIRERQKESAAQSKQPTDGDELLLRATEVSKRLAISPRLLHKITVEGLLPCVRVGRLVRYNAETIEQWIRDRESSCGTERRRKGVPNGPKTNPANPDGVSQSKDSPKPIQAELSPPKAKEEPKNPSPTERRQSTPGRVEERPNPLALLLKDIGVDQDDLGSLTNRQLMRIAQVDLPTFHGWMHLGREMPKEALENLRRHFATFEQPADRS